MYVYTTRPNAGLTLMHKDATYRAWHRFLQISVIHNNQRIFTA